MTKVVVRHELDDVSKEIGEFDANQIESVVQLIRKYGVFIFNRGQCIFSAAGFDLSTGEFEIVVDSESE